AFAQARSALRFPYHQDEARYISQVVGPASCGSARVLPLVMRFLQDLLNRQPQVEKSGEDVAQIVAKLQHAVRPPPGSLRIGRPDSISLAVPVHELRSRIGESHPVVPAGSQHPGDFGVDLSYVWDIAHRRRLEDEIKGFRLQT